MPVSCEDTFSTFFYLGFLYTSPIITFFITRAIVLLPDSPSVYPTVLGSCIAIVVIFLICIPIHLSANVEDPIRRDDFFLFFIVGLLHVFLVVIVSEILHVPTWVSYVFGVALSPLTFRAMQGLLSTMAPTDDRLFLQLPFPLAPSTTPTNNPAPPQDAPLREVPQCKPDPDADKRRDIVFDSELEALEENQSGIANMDGQDH